MKTGLGGRVLPGPCQAAAGWNGAELCQHERQALGSTPCVLSPCCQQADGHQL